MSNRVLALVALCCLPALAGDEAFNGKWIIEPKADSPGRVAWLEIKGAGGGAITGSAISLGPGGQLDPVHDAKIIGGLLSFHLERESGRGDRRKLIKTPTTARVVKGELQGTTVLGNEERSWVGRRAPVINDRDDGSWKAGQPVALFDGKDLSKWRTLNPGRESEWLVEDGVMKNHEHADVLVSKDKFWNFRLQCEYRVHPGMNGGIGLRARYEIQILDDFGKPLDGHSNGGLYSRILPKVNASKPALEWQSFDIRLVGRELTVELNGTRIIDRQIVEGFTAMATDAAEDQPGPISLQGDHGAVEFRKIVVTPLALF